MLIILLQNLIIQEVIVSLFHLDLLIDITWPKSPILSITLAERNQSASFSTFLWDYEKVTLHLMTKEVVTRFVLLGLMSRCTMPELWMYWSPREIYRRISWSLGSWKWLPDCVFRYSSLQAPTIAVFILNDHVVILCPCRVVRYHMGVMPQHHVGMNFMHSQILIW